jgi:hypothetical protein
MSVTPGDGLLVADRFGREAARQEAERTAKKKTDRQQSPVEQIEIRCDVGPGLVERDTAQNEFIDDRQRVLVV